MNEGVRVACVLTMLLFGGSSLRGKESLMCLVLITVSAEKMLRGVELN